jgi:hypothetical protein
MIIDGEFNLIIIINTKIKYSWMCDPQVKGNLDDTVQLKYLAWLNFCSLFIDSFTVQNIKSNVRDKCACEALVKCQWTGETKLFRENIS